MAIALMVFVLVYTINRTRMRNGVLQSTILGCLLLDGASLAPASQGGVTRPQAHEGVYWTHHEGAHNCLMGIARDAPSGRS